MGKVKIKKKSTLIDMTAMSDVTVLLLTFFMLTSTFIQKEPTTVRTPSSVSVEAIPAKDLVTILVSAADPNDKSGDPTLTEGKIFLAFQGDSTIKSEDLRKDILKAAISTYNQRHPSKKLSNPTEAQIDAFSKIQMFGVPFESLYEVLDMDPVARDKYLSDIQNPKVGIPINDNKEKKVEKYNEFQIWMDALAKVAQKGRTDAIEKNKLDEYNDADKEKIRDLDILYNAIYQGNSIAVKADKDTPFMTIHRVFDNLQTMGLNKFNMITNLKAEEAVKD
ncbi:MAG: biopolymer transporter ExbD [Muribaculaceae bacterium]|nr:biopolymer transporter ExbD [Muribaculaceae bacterium]